MNPTRKSYASDVADGEWEFLLPSLTLMREDSLQRWLAAVALLLGTSGLNSA
jgi:hypothetical protein